ncbi:MAG TPA: KH domain-containing protein [Candidatus Nanoarchaeia archaeon]|nr:KH domain-containing protein [Candidatus Nanoarchaeia archaeon]
MATATEKFSYSLKIPLDRVGVLIGPSGNVKKQLEQDTNTSLLIDSREGEVEIISTSGVHLYEAREIVRAIGRGFNPGIAMHLLKQDYALEVVNVDEFTGKNKNASLRLKGRVIGSEGKAKREIERLTDCVISVYGKTVALVGPVDMVVHARRAIEDLLAGSTHARVYRFLEKKRREHKIMRIVGSI